MRFKYFHPDGGETIDDARDVHTNRHVLVDNEYVWRKTYSFADHDDALDAAAEIHYKASYPDWHEGERTIAIVDEAGVVKTFAVMLEYSPTFTAKEITNG